MLKQLNFLMPYSHLRRITLPELMTTGLSPYAIYCTRLLKKILANRLREVLDSLVGPDQTTFVKLRAGTSIENVLFRA